MNLEALDGTLDYLLATIREADASVIVVKALLGIHEYVAVSCSVALWIDMVPLANRMILVLFISLWPFFAQLYTILSGFALARQLK